MTLVINDFIFYRGVKYNKIATSSQDLLFDPREVGLNPTQYNAPRLHSHHATFMVSGNQLLLKDLFVNLRNHAGENQKGPTINNILPICPKQSYTSIHELLNTHLDNYYQDVLLPIKYTGGILVAEGLIVKKTNMYAHIAYDQALKNNNIVELIFDKGFLTEAIDASAKVKRLRENIVCNDNEVYMPKTILDQLNLFMDEFKHSYASSIQRE